MCCYFFWGVGVCFEITRAGIRKWRQESQEWDPCHRWECAQGVGKMVLQRTRKGEGIRRRRIASPPLHPECPGHQKLKAWPWLVSCLFRILPKPYACGVCMCEDIFVSTHKASCWLTGLRTSTPYSLISPVSPTSCFSLLGLRTCCSLYLLAIWPWTSHFIFLDFLFFSPHNMEKLNCELHCSIFKTSHRDPLMGQETNLIGQWDVKMWNRIECVCVCVCPESCVKCVSYYVLRSEKIESMILYIPFHFEIWNM